MSNATGDIDIILMYAIEVQLSFVFIIICLL